MAHRWFRLQSLFITTGLVASFGLPTVGRAEGLSIQPSAYRFTVDQGAAHSETLNISNGGSEAVEITTEMASVRALRDTGELQFSALDDRQASSFYRLKVVPSSVSLAAGETATLSVIIQTQPNALPGGYSLGVKLSSLASQPAVSVGAVNQKSITTINVPVLFTVKGPQQVSGKLTDFTVQPSLVRGSSPVNFSAQINNISAVHAGVTGTISIYKGQTDQLVDRIVLSRLLVFPGSQRTIQAAWQPKLPRGLYRAQLDVTLAGLDDSESQQLTATTQITLAAVVWPWIALSIGLVLTLLSWLAVRRYRNIKTERWIQKVIHRKLAL